MVKWICIGLLGLGCAFTSPPTRKQHSMKLKLEAVLPEGDGTAFTFLPDTRKWALGGSYDTGIFEDLEKIDSVEARSSQGGMRFEDQGQVLWVGSIKVAFPDKQMEAIPQLWDETGQSYIRNLAFCDDQIHALAYVRNTSSKGLRTDPFLIPREVN